MVNYGVFGFLVNLSLLFNVFLTKISSSIFDFDFFMTDPFQVLKSNLFSNLLELSCNILTLYVLIPQNGQTYSNNSFAVAHKLFECVWPFCVFGVWRVKCKMTNYFQWKMSRGESAQLFYHFEESSRKCQWLSLSSGILPKF